MLPYTHGPMHGGRSHPLMNGENLPGVDAGDCPFYMKAQLNRRRLCWDRRRERNRLIACRGRVVGGYDRPSKDDPCPPRDLFPLISQNTLRDYLIRRDLIAGGLLGGDLTKADQVRPLCARKVRKIRVG